MAGNQKPGINVTRIKMSLPSMYVLGRTSPGVGPVELIPIYGGSGQDLASMLKSKGTLPPSGGTETESTVGFSFIDPPLASTSYYGATSTHDATFPGGTATAVCRTAPFASSTIGIYAETLGHVGDIAWAKGSLSGVVTWDSASFTLPAGKAIYLTTPAAQELQMRNVTIVFPGTLA